MEIGTIMSVAQTLLTTLQCSQLKQFCSLFGYKSDLDALQSVVATISAVLRDADSKQQSLSEQEKHFVKELKEAIYDADDVLDEFSILIDLNKLTSETGGSFTKRVRSYLCRFKPVAFDISRKIKKVQKKLDMIASKSSLFSFKLDYKPIMCRREDTCSYVYADDIIGRANDVENIMSFLMGCDDDVSVDRNVCFVTIVGIGGLGKTALAQLVYNDERIASAFGLRLWVCVSDQDRNRFNLFEILGKILESIIGGKHDATSLDQVQKRLRERLEGKKYLLVLDDVWTENYDQWRELSRFLIGGVKGSWVVVTTRSRGTASVVGNGPMYELKGLSKEDSWILFKKTAIEVDRKSPSEDLVSIGEEIVKRCAYVPLAIRAIGSLLYGQSKKRWELVKEMGLASIDEAETGIMSILKLSYHNLTSPLKICFAYCAVFPKDYEIDKETLISLWMAQGYIVPLNECQSIEDVGEEYFSILLRRCFFQDVSRGKYGEIVSCKIHDIMHDIAQEVAGKEILGLKHNTLVVNGQVRHISVGDIGDRKAIFTTKTNIRTYLQLGGYLGAAGFSDQAQVSKLLARCTYLRTLDLSRCRVRSLPESIGGLLHLRYLDLSFNFMELLPKTITKLCKLQTLKLIDCNKLKELPKDVSKLVNLSTLDITTHVEKLPWLSHMPCGMSKLTRLHTLGKFVVGGSSSSEKNCFDGLFDLKSLNNLKGTICVLVDVPKTVSCRKEDLSGGAFLRRKEHLNCVDIRFRVGEGYGRIEEEFLLEELQPHSNLKELCLKRYHGIRFPNWPMVDESAFDLPNLVRIEIKDCDNLLFLPPLGRLRHLKHLELSKLSCVEYLVNDNPEALGSGGEESSFFPSLEELSLWRLPKLKGWWPRTGLLEQKDHMDSSQGSPPCFSQLKIFWMSDCPEMTVIPVCPRLEALHFSLKATLELKNLIVSLSSSPQQSLTQPYSGENRPQKLIAGNMEWLKLVPTEYIKHLAEIEINCENEVERMSEVGELFHKCLFSSLRFLRFRYCLKLRSLCGWLEHFSSLEGLFIHNCPNLILTNTNSEEGGIPWRHLSRTLHSLVLSLSNYKNCLVELPDGIQHLTSLKSLKISHCGMIKSLPKWMPKLTSLVSLELLLCSVSLERRCRNPDGEDWALIQHIPSISIIDAVIEDDEFNSELCLYGRDDFN